MQRETSLPPDFAELNGAVNYIVKRGIGQFSSSCPNCGGMVHPDGQWPDRFVLWQQSRATGKPMGWCRSCGYIWHPGKLKGETWKPTHDQVLEWERERKEAEELRRSEVERALALLEAEASWRRYHEQLNEQARAEYHRRRIDDFWIDFWELGYCPEKFASHAGQTFSSPSLTIPVFEPVSKRPLNVKHRLLRPLDPGDKYRPDIRGLSPALYFADLEKPVGGNRLLVVEGEFKAMTTYIGLDDPDLQVVGLPGKAPDLSLIEPLNQYQDIVISLDPDAYITSKGVPAITRLVNQFQKPVRVMQLVGKIDDMLLSGQLNKQSLRSMIRSARLHRKTI